jgi:hypothetical protein
MCEAWLRVAKANGAYTAQAAIRAKNLVICGSTCSVRITSDPMN